MCSDYVEEKTGLINALIKDRKLSDLPKISQVIYHPFNISEFYMKFIHKRWFSLYTNLLVRQQCPSVKFIGYTKSLYISACFIMFLSLLGQSRDHSFLCP